MPELRVRFPHAVRRLGAGPRPGSMTGRGIALAALAGAIAALAACSVTLGSKFPAENVAALVVGKTTEADLQTMFGPPVIRRVLQSDDTESTILGWAWGTSSASTNKGHELHVETVDNLVNGFLFSSSLEPGSTDFDLALADQLHEGRSKIADAEKLLGPADGRMRLPTALLFDWFGPMKVLRPPDNATQAVVWCYLDLTVQQYAATRHVKLLALYAGQDDTVTAIRRFDGVR
ncbi:MAG TPA: hypothetical protein VFQ07_09120 [Candidatus Polarisedimenticolia bacterium]|nr:hypothetical protein [Candidatus Polarisedimenticolia bacterium]